MDDAALLRRDDANRSAALIRRRSSRPAPDLEKRFSLAPSLVAIGSATSSTHASSLGALVQYNSTASLDAASLIAAKSRGDVERHDVDSIMSQWDVIAAELSKEVSALGRTAASNFREAPRECQASKEEPSRACCEAAVEL